MMKVLGAACVAAASMMVGLFARQGISRQLSLLRQFRMALEIMQGEMELDMPPLGTLFESVGGRLGGEIGDFFLGTGETMARSAGRSPQMAMRIRLEDHPLPLDREETAMLLELGGALGRYDLMGQARAMNLFRQRLDQRIASLEGTRREKSKAWMTASVCSGLMLILMLI